MCNQARLVFFGFISQFGCSIIIIFCFCLLGGDEYAFTVAFPFVFSLGDMSLRVGF